MQRIWFTAARQMHIAQPSAVICGEAPTPERRQRLVSRRIRGTRCQAPRLRETRPKKTTSQPRCTFIQSNRHSVQCLRSRHRECKLPPDGIAFFIRPTGCLAMHPVALLTTTALLLTSSAVSLSTPAVAGATRNADAACAWDHPGRDPFIGDLTQALDHYRDIPADARKQLKLRMASHDYDDVVVITRDSIEGRQSYGSRITGMHFGAGRVCGSVTRDRWDVQHREAGLVYCAGQHCVLVPSVCRNLSRIVPRGGPGPGHPQSPPELVFEPPGAISPPVPPASTPDLPPTLVSPPVGIPPSLVPPVALPPAFPAPPDAPPPLLVDTPPDIPPRLTPPPEVFWPPALPPEYAPPGVGVPAPPVPEPQSWILLILGAAALAFWFTRRR